VEEPIIETLVDLPAEPTTEIVSFLTNYDVSPIPDVA